MHYNISLARQAQLLDAAGNYAPDDSFRVTPLACADYAAAPAPSVATATAVRAAAVCACADDGCLNASAARAGARGAAVPFVVGQAVLPQLTVPVALPALRLYVTVRGRDLAI
jgi:hypothetical protein